MAATELLAPCGWTADTDCCSVWTQGTPAQQARAEAIAIAVLWRLSGRQFGRCPRTIRPCRRPRAQSWWPNVTGWWPSMHNGEWFNACGCGSSCSCAAAQSVDLPGYLPEPTRVTVDGVDLPEDAYQVHNGRHLVRVDGEAWPTCQDMSLPATAPGTWEVEYEHGVPLPADGPAAVGTYACEILKACLGTTGCELPRRLQSLSRQGVDITLMDPGDYLDKGRTGVQRVDEWLATVNPHHLSGAPTVYSPDLPEHVEVTWP